MELCSYLLCLDRQALHKGVVDAVAVLCAYRKRRGRGGSEHL